MLKKYHLEFDKVDERDLIFGSVHHKSQLPDSVDLRDKFTVEPFDQGQLGSCTANALVGLREYNLGLDKKPYTHLSRLFIYYFERYLEGTVNEDSGASLRDGMRVLQKLGVCPEMDEEYDISKFTEKPSDKAITDALQFKISTYKRVTNVHALQSALANENVVAIGFRVFDSFESLNVAKTGIVPLPKVGERELGGHAVLIFGYKNINGKLYFIVRNSWGVNWGDKGYCYMPVEFFEKGFVVDMWTGR